MGLHFLKFSFYGEHSGLQSLEFIPLVWALTISHLNYYSDPQLVFQPWPFILTRTTQFCFTFFKPLFHLVTILD